MKGLVPRAVNRPSVLSHGFRGRAHANVSIALLNAKYQQQEYVVMVTIFVVAVCGSEFGCWPAYRLGLLDTSMKAWKNMRAVGCWPCSSSRKLKRYYFQLLQFFGRVRPCWSWRFLLNILYDFLSVLGVLFVTLLTEFSW